MAKKGKTSSRLIKDHPKPVHIIDPRTMDSDVTLPDRLDEDEQLAHIAHRIELDRSLGRDDPDDDMSENDPAPPEGGW